MIELPKTCCKNIGGTTFKSCGKPATHWYRHNEDICFYCDECNYKCGEEIKMNDYFAIVWAGSSLYYLCDDDAQVEEKIKMLLNDPNPEISNSHIRVLKPTLEYKNGKRIVRIQ